MTLPLFFENRGRCPATVFVVLLSWATLLAAYILIDAALLVLMLLWLFTLPAVYDLITNPVASFHLDDKTLVWRAGRQRAQIAVSEIDHLRLDTRLDMSVRLTAVRPSGRKIRVPYPATPSAAAIEKAADRAGIAFQRHHFSLMG